MVNSSKQKKIHRESRSSASSNKVIQRQSISILEEHEHIKISIKNINDYKSTYLDTAVIFSDSDGDDDEYDSITDICDSDEEYTFDDADVFNWFKTNEFEIYKRTLKNEADIVKTLKASMTSNDTIILNKQNQSKYYKILSKKYDLLSYKDFVKIIILYGLYPTEFATINLKKPILADCNYSDLISRVFKLNENEFEIDLVNWNLKAKRSFKAGTTVFLDRRIPVKTLQDISLIKMALKCENCDVPLQPKNVSLKAKLAELPKKEGNKQLTQNVIETFKCDQCNISFCSLECYKEKIKLHKDLHHPSLKYKPNIKIDGKKYLSLENKLLNNNLEDVFTLMDLQGADLPSPKFNILNAPYQQPDFEVLYQNVFELFKDVFTEYPLNYTDFLEEVGKHHYLNLFKDPETNFICPLSSVLTHSCEDSNVKIYNNVLHFVTDVFKGNIIKLDFYEHCTKNISSDIGRYAFLKNNFGIHCNCKKCLQNEYLLNRRRKSSVRFVDKVTAFNLAQ
ncbi:hypothetical protein QEN19_002596 [Hanseniaspora menglaensis]